MSTSSKIEATAVVRGAGDGEALWFRDNRTIIKVRAHDTAGAYGLVESWAPAGTGTPLHVHRREDEAFYILSGTLRVRCGEEEFSAGPGAYALLPRDVPHAFRVEGDEPAHLLTLISPGSGEGFFAAAGEPADGPDLPPPAPPDIQRLRRAAAPFGIEILGPPMDPPGKENRA
jgi:mannose-6-phosphate isomerase-like protein (cupin superfamily)